LYCRLRHLKILNMSRCRAYTISIAKRQMSAIAPDCKLVLDSDVGFRSVTATVNATHMNKLENLAALYGFFSVSQMVENQMVEHLNTIPTPQTQAITMCSWRDYFPYTNEQFYNHAQRLVFFFKSLYQPWSVFTE